MRIHHILLVILPLAVQTKDTHFDILIFTQHWPYTTCIDWEEKRSTNACKDIDRPAWEVHGLWPTQFGKIAPSYCNESWKFDYSSVEPIRAQLDIYWPDLELRNEPNSLWTHEFEKHGTCAAQLPALSTELKYFQCGIDLAKKLPITDWLVAKNIVPGGRYTKNDVYSAILENTKKRPHIDCEHLDGEQYIKEIKICLNKNLTLTHCDNIVVGGLVRKSGGTCKDNMEFVYPAKDTFRTSSHLLWGTVFGVTGAVVVLALLVVLYLKTNRSRRGYENI